LNWLLINAIAISPFVLGAAGNYLAWEKRFEKIVNAKKNPTPSVEPATSARP
jgi:hypothetical protein